jgi:hypothetical protein
MFATIRAATPADGDYPARCTRLDILARILDGTFYDVLPYEFHEERTSTGEYIPLRMRRPSVRYPLARIVVDDSLSLVFSDGHFPAFACADSDTRRALGGIALESGLNGVMAEAALRGSVGSVAILMRVLKGRVFFRVLDTRYLTPVYDPEAPDTLLSLTERYKVSGANLAAQGYDLAAPAGMFWFQRSWDATAETWFAPAPLGSNAPPDIDEARTVRHDLGFVPVVWIKNLPGGPDGPDGVDGACTFRPAVETSIEIDYQLSQAGRGLKYSSDPMLMIREPAGTEGELVRGGGNALLVSERGDAKLLEIGGTASAAVIEYVRTLREMALEGVHGNRSSADRIAAAQSGRALELMNQGLIWLADNLRVSYGRGLLGLARMIVLASQRFTLTVAGEKLPPLDPAAPVSLNWPRWYPLTSTEMQQDAGTLATLIDAGILSRETALASIGDVYGVNDIDRELARAQPPSPPTPDLHSHK